eukprot:3232714-Rhodomonas_salina.3
MGAGALAAHIDGGCDHPPSQCRDDTVAHITDAHARSEAENPSLRPGRAEGGADLGLVVLVAHVPHPQLLLLACERRCARQRRIPHTHARIRHPIPDSSTPDVHTRHAQPGIAHGSHSVREKEKNSLDKLHNSLGQQSQSKGRARAGADPGRS